MASIAGTSESEGPDTTARTAAKKPPIRPVTPRLRIVLYVVLTLFGVLAANGLYLTSITWLQHFSGQVYETHFYQLMFLIHLGLGLLLIVPVVGFGLIHMWRARNRRNRRAVKIGYALFAVSLAILISGVLLTRIGSLSIVNPGDAECRLLASLAGATGRHLALLASPAGRSANQVACRPSRIDCDRLPGGVDGRLPSLGPSHQRR